MLFHDFTSQQQPMMIKRLVRCPECGKIRDDYRTVWYQYGSMQYCSLRCKHMSQPPIKVSCGWQDGMFHHTMETFAWNDPDALESMNVLKDTLDRLGFIVSGRKFVNMLYDKTGCFSAFFYRYKGGKQSDGSYISVMKNLYHPLYDNK